MTDQITETPTEEPAIEAPAEQEPQAQGALVDESQETIDDDLHEEKRRGKTAQDRINDLTRARREAERERDYYKGLVSPDLTPVSTHDVATEPEPDQFDDYNAYVKALAKWEIQQTLSQTSKQAMQQAEQNSRQSAWNEKVGAVTQSIPDYNEVVGSSEIPIAPHVADALMDSDRGPELAYHMARNPDFADRLNSMSPVKAALELGRLETTLTATPVKAASKAPIPATPIRPSTSMSADPAKMSMDEYVKWRQQRQA